MPAQYGFSFDENRCVQCRTCEIACKSTHNIEPGINWRRVTDTWEGEFPNVKRTFFSQACMHCEEPVCAEVCPTGAIHKRPEDGIVVVDRDACSGCRNCAQVCPYGAPQFGVDGIMQKCDYCTGLGKAPECAESCPAEALDYGTLDELMQRAKDKGKSASKMEGTTGPSIIIIR